jgi:acyl carrier protein
VSEMTPVQAATARHWTAVFGIANVEPRSDFLDVGGDSVTAAILVARLRTEFSIALTIGDLLEHSTVRAMSALVEDRLRGRSG